MKDHSDGDNDCKRGRTNNREYWKTNV